MAPGPPLPGYAGPAVADAPPPGGLLEVLEEEPNPRVLEGFAVLLGGGGNLGVGPRARDGEKWSGRSLRSALVLEMVLLMPLRHARR